MNKEEQNLELIQRKFDDRIYLKMSLLHLLKLPSAIWELKDGFKFMLAKVSLIHKQLQLALLLKSKKTSQRHKKCSP